ncbi:hypothetical protein [Thermosediminibacter oceani]|uniref:Uncharacterized protein n=1 Tax=Thermosediminibacter oceani (strain ATCC BAA-1034 / DSM 16646 / JW/IW-1228P) TaxID=555079 RepID=D9S3R5_THEOJ|nr:hypothetical protein [Thermosediminibacter oceani]ADL08042.1 hypothetical protein Toce_1286 [Thermosediminibacter oceani DSM 16646]
MLVEIQLKIDTQKYDKIQELNLSGDELFALLNSNTVIIPINDRVSFRPVIERVFDIDTRKLIIVLDNR